MNAKETRAVPNTEVESLVAEIVEEFLQQLDGGEQPEIEVYARRYPQIADVVRKVLSTLRVMRTVTMDAESMSDAAEPNKLTKRTLGDFKIIREIGRGGMGVVYEAEQISLDRQVALKVLPFASVLDDRQLQRFKNEAQAAAQLHHTNIVPVFSVGCERGLHYYAMQFVKGPTLANVIRELRQLSGLDTAQLDSRDEATSRLAEDLTSGRFAPASQAAAEGSPVKQTAPDETASSTLGTLAKENSTKSPEFFRSVANLGVQAAKALEHAHSNGIIHRDIKPSNLLLDVKGTLWVTDFGLAQFRSDTGLKLTMSGDLLGTIRYMSTEQALGKHALLDHRTDIYSLGVTMYELLTLEPAFTGRDRQELVRKITDEEPRALRRLNEATPTDLETIVLKAMTKEPETRYATAQELSDDLQRFLEDKPIKAKRPTLAQRAAKWSRRHKTVVWSGVVLLLMAMVGLAISTFLIARKQVEVIRQRDLAVREQQRAQANLRLAMEALDEIYLKVAERQLAQADFIDDADRQLLQTALMFYGKFTAENRSSIESRYETAKAHLRVGEIRKMLGDPKGVEQAHSAEQAYRDAITLFEELVAEFPTIPEYRSDLVKALRGLSEALSDTGRKERVDRYLPQAIDIGEKLVADFPGQPEFRYQLSLTYRVVGQWLRETGSLEKAEQNLRRSVEVVEKLATEFPDVREYRYSLAENYLILCESVALTGRGEEAKQNLRKSVELGKKLMAEFPSEPKFRNCLARAYRLLAFHSSQRQESEDAYRRCIEISEKLVEEFPTVPGYRSTLGTAYQCLGHMQRDPNDREEAYRQALEIFEKLRADFPTVTLHQINLAAMSNTLGKLLMSIGRFEEAEESLRRAVEIVEKLMGENPSVPEYRRDLAANCSCLGVLLNRTNQSEEAEKVFRKGLEAAEQLVSDYPAVIKYQSGQLAATYNLSSLYVSAGRLEDAGEVLRHALAIVEKLMAENPSVTSLPSHQVRLLKSLSVHLTDAIRPEEAEKVYRKALEVAEQLVSENPTVTKYQIGHVAATNNLWNFCKSAGRLEDAEEAVRHALAIGEKLMAENPSTTFSTHGAELLRGLCVHFIDAGQPEEVEKFYFQTLNHYEKLVADFPDAPHYRAHALWILNNLAWHCATSAEPTYRAPTWAVKFAEESVEGAPGQADFLNTLGVAYYRAGKWQEAGEALLKSTELGSGGNSNDFFFLAMARWQLGNREQARQWYNKAVEWMEQKRPDYYELRRFRVETEALLGINDVPAPDGDAEIWYRHAAAQLGAGQMEEYRKTCDVMLQRFDQTENPKAAYWVAWTCALAPEAVENLDQVIPLAEKAAESDNPSGQHLNALGAVLYRAGRFNEAIRKLSELTPKWEQTGKMPNSTSPAYKWYFLAMAHHQLGHLDESRKWLDKAIEHAEQEIRQGTTSSWRRQTLQLLRREAELLIGQSEQTTPNGKEVVPVENK